MTTYRFTIVARWEDDPDTDEEIDVDVKVDDKLLAELTAQEELNADYLPGWKIVDVIGPRTGLYL